MCRNFDKPDSIWAELMNQPGNFIPQVIVSTALMNAKATNSDEIAAINDALAVRPDAYRFVPKDCPSNETTTANNSERKAVCTKPPNGAEAKTVISAELNCIDGIGAKQTAQALTLYASSVGKKHEPSVKRSIHGVVEGHSTGGTFWVKLKR